MPNELTLFHGATGDEILSVIRERSMRPDRDGLVYFSEKFEDVLQYGADTRRKATALKAKLGTVNGLPGIENIKMYLEGGRAVRGGQTPGGAAYGCAAQTGLLSGRKQAIRIKEC